MAGTDASTLPPVMNGEPNEDPLTLLLQGFDESISDTFYEIYDYVLAHYPDEVRFMISAIDKLLKHFSSLVMVESKVVHELLYCYQFLVHQSDSAPENTDRWKAGLDQLENLLATYGLQTIVECMAALDALSPGDLNRIDNPWLFCLKGHREELGFNALKTFQEARKSDPSWNAELSNFLNPVEIFVNSADYDVSALMSFKNVPLDDFGKCLLERLTNS